MKLTTVTNISVDGVMQGLGGPDEDRRGAFERSGPQLMPAWAGGTPEVSDGTDDPHKPARPRIHLNQKQGGRGRPTAAGTQDHKDDRSIR